MPPPRKLKPNDGFTQKAFTLAEVLITLGVIGIVAALTIPQVITNYQKKATVAKLKKAYSLAAQVIENDEIGVWNWDNWDSAETILREHFVPKLQVTEIYPPKSAYSPMCENSQYTWLGGTGIGSPFLNSTASLRLNDGTCLGLNGNDNEWEGQFNYNFFIDINGPQKPNVAGIDLFFFYINSKGQLRPYGDTLTDEQLNNNPPSPCEYKEGNNYGGRSCALKIIRDGWEMKKDYPWKWKKD